MKFNITQHLSQCLPGHWLLPPPSRPLSEDLCVDLHSISSVFVFYVTDSSSIGFIQEQDAKLAVIRANFSWNVDGSLPPLELDAVQYSRAVCGDSTKNIQSALHTTSHSLHTTSVQCKCKDQDLQTNPYKGSLLKLLKKYIQWNPSIADTNILSFIVRYP